MPLTLMKDGQPITILDEGLQAILENPTEEDKECLHLALQLAGKLSGLSLEKSRMVRCFFVDIMNSAELASLVETSELELAPTSGRYS